MELIFLEEQTLKVLDHAHCSDDFEIVLDSLVPQKSKFTVTKQGLNAETSDILLVRENNYFYIGIITSIKQDDHGSTKIEAKDFLSVLDVEVPLPTSFSGNIATFITNLINQTYKNSGDSLQNLSYLEVVSEVYCQASLTYDEDSKENILDLIEEFSKTYGIRVVYELVVSDGRFTKIKLKIVQTKSGVTLKSSLGTITNLAIKDTNENSLNKIIFKPKAANATYKNLVTYYLLTDGTVTKTNTIAKRNPKVRFKYEYYADNDYPSLLTKATKALVDSSLKHSITFTFSFLSNKVDSLKDLNIGTFVEFVTNDKVYDTLITKIVYKKTFNIAEITLGEYRDSLTDKLKLIDRRS